MLETAKNLLHLYFQRIRYLQTLATIRTSFTGWPRKRNKNAQGPVRGRSVPGLSAGLLVQTIMYQAKPFPFDELSPDNFEDFVRAVLEPIGSKLGVRITNE